MNPGLDLRPDALLVRPLLRPGNRCFNDPEVRLRVLLDATHRPLQLHPQREALSGQNHYFINHH